MSYKYEIGSEYKSRNQDQIDDLTHKYVNREAFSYDPETDGAYQEYAKMMRAEGQRAMKDTVAKASSLTGGYANSYAATAGQQVYNDYISQIGAAQSKYMDRARDQYDAEGTDLMNKLTALYGQETVDKTAWEADYKRTWEQAEIEAANGNPSKLAKLLGMEEKTLKKNLGYGALTNEEIEGYHQAWLLGEENAKLYLDTLRRDGLYTSQLEILVKQWEAKGEKSGQNAPGYKEQNTPLTERKWTLLDKGGWYVGKVNDNAIYVDEFGKPFSGVELLSKLQSIGGMTEEQAKEWISTHLSTFNKKSGHKYFVDDENKEEDE